jgi:alkaline phosphatase D
MEREFLRHRYERGAYNPAAMPIYTLTPCGRALAGMSRRDLLKLASSLGAAALAPSILTRRVMAKPIFDAYPFALGVASGDPVPDGVVLWTRLAPKPLEGGGMPMVNVEVDWEVARDGRFTSIVQQGTSIARPELGHSVHVEVAGLEPGRDYWYRFRAGDEVSQVGRTKTAPAAGVPVDRLRFAVCGCNHYEDGYFTAFRRMSEEQFDFIFHTGDYIYEGRSDGGRVDRRLRQHNGDELYTLVDYRNRYALYKMDKDLMAAHASAPWVVTWDDHEVDNNYAGDIDENNTPPEIFALRRAAAYQAYYETMPLRASALPRGGHMQLYRRLQFGSLIDLSVLDTRQWRSDQPCGDGSRTNCAERLAPSQTMMGPEQEKWLFDNLATVKARWTVIGQQVYSFAFDRIKALPNGQFSMDKWDGYVAARQRLYNRLVETRAPNPIVLSGDVHQHYGADLKLDFTDPRSRTIGVEFTNTAVTTTGDGSDVGTTWEATKGDNPHIKFHSNRRGYIACTATPSQMRAEFKIIEKVSVPDLPARTAGALVVEAGRPGGVTD